MRRMIPKNNYPPTRKCVVIITIFICCTILTSLYTSIRMNLQSFCISPSTIPPTLKNITSVQIIKDAEPIKYIFDLSIWRAVLMLDQAIGDTSMCDILERVQPIASAFCLSILGKNCTQLPCALVYRSKATDQHETYLSNGRHNINSQAGDTNSNGVHQIECVSSPALELFMHGAPYPSLITNGYAHVTSQLYSDVLSEQFRSPSSVWGLSLNGESIGYYPWAGTKSVLSLFDITQGYDRNLYNVITDDYLYMDKQAFMADTRLSFNSAILDKSSAPSFVTAPIFWMNSNCRTRVNRTGYMAELMSYISVDSWGNCGRNKGPELPTEIAKIQGDTSNGNLYSVKSILAKKAMMKHYKFTVAIENSIEHDYVTEKLWQPLAVGSIPLYYGAPNVHDWLPCRNCIIDLRQFASAKEAAEYIKTVSQNETLYAQYHEWRNQPVLPNLQKIVDYFQRANMYTLKSMVCAMAHSKNSAKKRYEILSDIGPIF